MSRKNPITMFLDGGQVGEPLHIYVAGQLVLVYDGRLTETVETMQREVERARAAVAGIARMQQMLDDLRAVGEKPDGHGSKPAERKAAYAAGLEAALIREDQGRMFGELTDRFPPEHPEKCAHAFNAGWRTGDMLRRVVEIVEGGKS